MATWALAGTIVLYIGSGIDQLVKGNLPLGIMLILYGAANICVIFLTK